VAAPEPAQTGGNLDASAHDERPDVPVSPEDITQQTAAADLPAKGVAATALESAPQISSELSTQGSLSEADLTSLRDTAAMAATVGGKPVDEAASQFDADPAIASIVDSVLANLRPKIVEEISRKLGRK